MDNDAHTEELQQVIRRLERMLGEVGQNPNTGSVRRQAACTAAWLRSGPPIHAVDIALYEEIAAMDDATLIKISLGPVEWAKLQARVG
jgi:hypothetical protein